MIEHAAAINYTVRWVGVEWRIGVVFEEVKVGGRRPTDIREGVERVDFTGEPLISCVLLMGANAEEHAGIDAYMRTLSGIRS
jgi:hypothetical protein